MYKFAVVIGRFQPFHLGHMKMLEKAFKVGEKVVVVLGSAKCARNTKNPWNAKEREEMIRSVLTPEQNERVIVTHVRDYYYNDNMWVAEIQGKVRAAIGECRDVALVGHRKDQSSYYLSLFPQWKFEEHPAVNALNATDVRKEFFESGAAWLGNMVPEPVMKWLDNFQRTGTVIDGKFENDYTNLKEEYEFLKAYKELWSKAPYPPTFVTVDAVVIKSGHVLVVRRKGNPGKGLMALPGGFLNQDEFVMDGMLRELKEETVIKVPPKELRASVRSYRLFDAPGRSLRGRTISHGYLIDLGSGELPSVKGSDDAEKAFWLPIYDVLAREDEFFEDHAHIITSFIHK